MAKVTAKVMAKVMAKDRAGQYGRLRHSSDTQTERRTAGVMFEQGAPPPPHLFVVKVHDADTVNSGAEASRPVRL